MLRLFAGTLLTDDVDDVADAVLFRAGVMVKIKPGCFWHHVYLFICVLFMRWLDCVKRTPSRWNSVSIRVQICIPQFAHRNTSRGFSVFGQPKNDISYLPTCQKQVLLYSHSSSWTLLWGASTAKTSLREFWPLDHSSALFWEKPKILMSNLLSCQILRCQILSCQILSCQIP